MSKMDLSKIFLLKEFLVTILKNYAHISNDTFLFYDDKFLIFFSGIFLVIIKR
jgi:hypothetical protein